MGLFDGKVAIITGAGFAALKDGSAGSIGYGIATAYAKEGANLVITGRNVKKLEDAKARYTSKTGQVTELLKGMAKLSPEEKKTRGAAINETKQRIEAALDLVAPG